MLSQDINKRLRSGGLVILVEESDEFLAVGSAKLAAVGYQPITFASAADQDVIDKITAHRAGNGTLIVSDFLRAYGNNPIAARVIREVALQQAEKDKPSSRLILIEVPGVDVPAAIRSDIEYIVPAIPDVRELKNELKDFINQHDVKIHGGANGDEFKHSVAASVAGLPRHEANRLFCRCIIEEGKLSPVWLRREKAARVAERLGGALTFVDTDTPSVGGLGGLKTWLAARRKAFGTEEAKKYGLPEPKGVLLLGMPGTGKSLTAKTVAREWGLPLLKLDAGKLFGSLVGQSEAQTRQAIEAAEACSPCILWIDEIEKGLAGGGGLDGGTSQRVFGTLLTWLQEKTKPVFVVATANAIDGLPPELLRKGRFDEIFFVDLPTIDERVDIVRIHVLRHGRDVKVIKPIEIAKATDGFSGAEIEQAIIDGMFSSYDQDRDVRLDDILNVIKNTAPLSKTMEAKLTALRQWSKGKAKPAAAPVAEVLPSAPRRVGVS